MTQAKALPWHAVALGVFLLALLPVVGTDAVFSADEGAALAQVDLLERGDGWLARHPFPEVDPDGSAYPLDLSSQRSATEFAPFGKHPAYATLLVPAFRVAGQAGTITVSLAATVLAAVLAALLARRIDERATLPTLWATGFASPLLFDGYLVIAHTLAAALAAAAALFALRALERRHGVHLAAALIGGCVASGVVLRNEMVLFGAALGVGVVLAARSRAAMELGAAALGGAVAGFVLDRWLQALALGDSLPTGTGGTSRPSGLGGQIEGFVITWLLPAYERFEVADIVLAIVLATSIAAVAIARRRPEDRDGIILFAAVAAVAAFARALLDPAPVPGLIFAFPLLAAGAAAFEPGRWRGARALLPLGFVLFSGAVAATQYSTGGGGEWGGRYFAAGLPLAIPVVVVGILDLGRRVDPRACRVLVAGMAVVSLALAGLSVRALRDGHGGARDVAAAVVAVSEAVDAGDGGSPVVVTTAGATARFAWDRFERGRWLTVVREDLPTYLDRLRRAGIQRLTFVTRDPEDELRLVRGYEVTDETRPRPNWTIAVLAVE